MKNRRSRGLVGRVLLTSALLVAGACSKKASQTQPPAASRAPAASPAADENGKPASGSAPLPAPFDLGKLDAFQRKVYDQVVNREASACGKGHSLLHSVEHDGACRASLYAVRYVARLAHSGFSESEIGEKVKQRFRLARVPSIDVSRAPHLGDASGRVKIVEFADYQCDHCKEAQALMHQLLADYPKDVTLYFKHFPFRQHPNAFNAALATAAAQNQGKFWQFHEKVWENSDRLYPAVLEGLAKELGLDFARWYADLGTDEVRGRVIGDRTEGTGLEIHRTPAIFINGRRYSDEIDLPSLKDWIDEELGR
jgi:glutaredoxin